MFCVGLRGWSDIKTLLINWISSIKEILLFWKPESKAKSMNLKPIIPDEILDAHKQKIRNEIAKESVAPNEHLKLYDKYYNLITKQAERDIDQFLSEEHTFEEITAEVARYQSIREDIQYHSRKVVYSLNGKYLFI